MDDSNNADAARRAIWVSAVVKRDGDYAIVLDLDLAIYCHMLHKLGTINLPIVDVIKVGWGQHEVIFHDPKNLIRKLEVEFANSRPHNNFASAQRSLKRVMRNMVGRQHERYNQRRPEHNP